MSDLSNGGLRFHRPHGLRGSAPDRKRETTADTVTLKSGLPLSMSSGVPVGPNHRLNQQMLLKRLVLDIPLSAIALVVLLPMLAGLALMVSVTSRGPVLFHQKRVGLDGRDFSMLKFRTMRIDDCDDTGLNQVTAEDSRVTAIGRFLRATSLDELPQLWNILVGDMAIIGPRPMVKGQRAAGADYAEVVPYYDYRHRVRPGLSGWAQANGLRGPTTDLKSARERIDYDCAYVQNVSLALDIRIIIQTIAREFLTGSGI